MSFRKEFKFITTLNNFHILKKTIISQGAKKLFPSRKISSLYFDNNLFSSFHDSEEGVVPRKKIRLREYPEKSKKINLEIKISSIEGRFKTSKEIDKLNFEKIKTFGYLDKIYGICKPIINVTYSREYYEYKKSRFTFDRDIIYTSLNGRKILDSCNVFEIKLSDKDNIEEYINKFGLKNSRFSKYCRGVNSICF